MIRIVCPHCHTPLATDELEQVAIAGRLSLICPECTSVLASEPVDTGQYHTLEEHFADSVANHA